MSLSKSVVIILAGGEGRRLKSVSQERDKCELLLAGKPILHWVLERLQPQCDAIALNINRRQEAYAHLQLPCFDDGLSEAVGPLGGILRAMEWMREHHSDCSHFFTVPSDCPFLPSDLIAQLNQVDTDQVSCATHQGRQHPLCARWPTHLQSTLRDYLLKGQYAVQRWLEMTPHQTVDFPAQSFDPFFNVNRPQDLQLAEDIAQRFFRGAPTC